MKIFLLSRVILVLKKILGQETKILDVKEVENSLTEKKISEPIVLDIKRENIFSMVKGESVKNPGISDMILISFIETERQRRVKKFPCGYFSPYQNWMAYKKNYCN